MRECKNNGCIKGIGIKDECVSCYNKSYSKKWREANPNYKAPKRHKWERYGLTEEEYLTLVAQSNNLCQICGSPPAPRTTLAIDHCHETGKVRGLLCSRCNTGLGQFQDQVTRLERAIKYLTS